MQNYESHLETGDGIIFSLGTPVVYMHRFTTSQATSKLKAVNFDIGAKDGT